MGHQRGLSRRRFGQHLLGFGLAAAGVAVAAGCSGWPVFPAAQVRTSRVGLLSIQAEGSQAPQVAVLREALRQLGYVEGREYSLVGRYADTQPERLPALAAELVQLPVTSILSVGSLATRATQAATTTLPIIMVGVEDPLSAGFIASLDRPGGNLTGLSNLQGPLNAKRLQLLRDTVPGIASVAVLWDPTIGDRAGEFPDLAVAAEPLGLQLQSLEVSSADGLESAFEVARSKRAAGLITLDNYLTISQRDRIADLALKNRLPWCAGRGRPDAVAGALLAYAANADAQWRRAATYIDKILKGAKPAELPVEQPTKFDLALNLKTAQSLGLTIPPSVLAQATEVIQ